MFVILYISTGFYCIYVTTFYKSDAEDSLEFLYESLVGSCKEQCCITQVKQSNVKRGECPI